MLILSVHNRVEKAGLAMSCFQVRNVKFSIEIGSEAGDVVFYGNCSCVLPVVEKLHMVRARAQKVSCESSDRCARPCLRLRTPRAIC